MAAGPSAGLRLWACPAVSRRAAAAGPLLRPGGPPPAAWARGAAAGLATHRRRGVCVQIFCHVAPNPSVGLGVLERRAKPQGGAQRGPWFCHGPPTPQQPPQQKAIISRRTPLVERGLSPKACVTREGVGRPLVDPETHPVRTPLAAPRGVPTPDCVKSRLPPFSLATREEGDAMRVPGGVSDPSAEQRHLDVGGPPRSPPSAPPVLFLFPGALLRRRSCQTNCKQPVARQRRR